MKLFAEGGRSQVIIYESGFGARRGLDKRISGGIGAGLPKNIREAHRFLAYKYRSSDEIYIFDLSRGS